MAAGVHEREQGAPAANCRTPCAKQIVNRRVSLSEIFPNGNTHNRDDFQRRPKKNTPTLPGFLVRNIKTGIAYRYFEGIEHAWNRAVAFDDHFLAEYQAIAR